MFSEDGEIAQSVEQNGWHCISVAEGMNEDEVSFSYTCGLLKTFNHPDLIVLSLGSEDAYGLFAIMVEEIKKGRSFASGEVCKDLIGDLPVQIKDVHPEQHEIYMGYAMGYYRHIGVPGTLKAYQVFWPDQKNLFPSDLKCDPKVALLQPRLHIRPFRQKRIDYSDYGEFGS